MYACVFVICIYQTRYTLDLCGYMNKPLTSTGKLTSTQLLVQNFVEKCISAYLMHNHSAMYHEKFLT